MMQPVIAIQPQRYFATPKFQLPTFQKQPISFGPARQLQQTQSIEFDGKRLRKAVTRKTVDYNSSIVKHLENRVWQRDFRDRRAIQPDSAYYTEITPPISMPDNPINAVTTKFVRTSTNKMRCPIFCVAWTPEGRRLVTGASSGEFTLWNGLTFNFETILQAHDSPVRCMIWSHNDIWMVTGDHAGYVKYWQSNMNNVKMFQAHKEALRGISFCPMDTKFVTCSDDGTVRIWDFLKCFEEKILRGHGADVRCVDWHPHKALIVSGSKDSQQPIKLWDPKSGMSLATIHAHKNTVMDAKWNRNGNWLLTASRDHLIKLFDIRNMKEEIQTFRGHKKEATTLSWHPVHEGLFSSGGSDGAIMFWVVGADKEVGAMEQAHDSCVWSLAWHPLGHILCSGSNDHTSKFWTRNRPGDRMRDKYNLNTLPKGQDEGAEYDDSGTLSSIPGMGLEHVLADHLKPQVAFRESEVLVIPGLDFTSDDPAEKTVTKKVPFSKPIPKQFQQQWLDSKQPLLLAPPPESMGNNVSDATNKDNPAVTNTTAPGLMMPDPHQQPNQFMFQPNMMMGNPRMPPPNIHMMPPPLMPPLHGMERPPRPLLGERPTLQHEINQAPMGENFDANMQNQNSVFGGNSLTPDINFMNQNQNEQWRPLNNEPKQERANLYMEENNLQQQNMNQSENYSQFDENNVHPLPGSQFEGNDMRFSNNDIDLRLRQPSGHPGPPSKQGEMPPNQQKRTWRNGPGNEGPFQPEGRPPPQQDFRSWHNQDYNPGFPRHNSPYHSGRGNAIRGQPRGMFRGQSPYHINNQRGRGRGAYE